MKHKTVYFWFPNTVKKIVHDTSITKPEDRATLSSRFNKSTTHSQCSLIYTIGIHGAERQHSQFTQYFRRRESLRFLVRTELGA